MTSLVPYWKYLNCISDSTEIIRKILLQLLWEYSPGKTRVNITWVALYVWWNWLWSSIIEETLILTTRLYYHIACVIISKVERKKFHHNKSQNSNKRDVLERNKPICQRTLCSFPDRKFYHTIQQSLETIRFRPKQSRDDSRNFNQPMWHFQHIQILTQSRLNWLFKMKFRQSRMYIEQPWHKESIQNHVL